MKHNFSPFAAINPMLAWFQLASTVGETIVASAAVINHRTARMALAGPLPGRRDQREFALMGQEKIQAGAESVQAMTGQLLQTNQALLARAFGQMLANTNAMISVAASRTAGQSLARQAVLAKSLARSAVTANQLSNTGVRLAHHGLKPIHAKATANAKRLKKG
jgi:hypothetical protein